MNHAELSRELALALGWPHVQRIGKGIFVSDNALLERAGWFDYRDPTVCLPLIEWLMLRGVNVWNPDGIPTAWEWSEPMGMYGKAESLAEAVARAVIAVKKGQV